MPSDVLQQKIASPGHGILAMDESNATCGKRLDSIGMENTEANRQVFPSINDDGLTSCHQQPFWRLYTSRLTSLSSF